MSQKKPFPETISTADLAKILGITPQRLGQLATAGIIAKTSHGFYPVSAISAYCAFLRGGGAEEAAEDADDGSIDLRRERARLVNVQRRIAERELDILEDKYVPIELVKSEVAADYNIVKNRIRGVPNKVASQLCFMTQPADIASHILREIDVVLNELSEDGNDVAEKALKESRNEK